MGKTVDTASSTTVKNVDKLSKELVVELSTEETKDKKSFEELLEECNLSEIDFFINVILIGIALVGLKKKHLDRFYNVVDTSKISIKQVGRRMKLVLEHTVDFSKCMDNSGTQKELVQRVSKLKIDKRLSKPTHSMLKDIFNISLEKIENMKHLSDPDFNTALSDSDEPYKKLVEEQNAVKAAKNKKNADAEKDKHIPDGMDKVDFYNQLDKGVYGVISLLHTANTLNGNLENDVSDLEAKNSSLSNELLVAQTKLAMYEKMLVKANLPSEMPDSFNKQSEKKAS